MRFFLITILFFPGFIICQSNSVAEFQAEVDSSGMIFEMPEGFASTEIIENKDLHYSFAITNADQSMEIRYTIWPLKQSLLEYEESLQDSTKTMVNPNKLFQARVQANMMNMTGGQIYNITKFPPAAVRKEFNANQGGACFFEFNCDFGKDWVYGQFIYLHKENQADVIITFMSKDADRHAELMQPAFHALKFKENAE